MFSTKELAKELGLIERIEVERKINNASNSYSIQVFKYILVLDFEATCQEKKDRSFRSEIIEFSVVLYKIETGNILAEFQQYVMPMENAKLSEFCTKLTGITQEKVDNGVPIGTCLMLFNQWIIEQEKKFGIIMYKNQNENGNCAFVTWTDWDLGICLLKECKRKTLILQSYFKKWIDLKHIYMKYYNRRPQGLQGALHEVGIEFSGKQHCGLDDAKNTAFLAGRMIKDGILLNITKELL